MNSMESLIRWAGVVQLVIAASNFVIPRIFSYHDNINRMSAMVRQVFVVHAMYIVAVVAFQGVLCLTYPTELAGGSGMGRFMSVYLAVFWLVRIGIQFFYYDPDVKRRYRWGDVMFTTMFVYLGVVFALAAWGGAT